MKKVIIFAFLKLFHDEGSYHIETSPLICSANQWTGFYMIWISVIKELTLGKTLIELIDTFQANIPLCFIA